MTWRVIAAALTAYLLGSIPWGYLLYKSGWGEDIRSRGSGNIGATNVLRTAGTAAGALTLLLDAGKGYVAVLLAARLAPIPLAIAAAAFLAVVGHCYPVFLKFRGGKGVATSLGAFAAISPVAMLIAACVFLAVMLVSRYVSLASITAAVSFPLILLLRGNTEMPMVVAAALTAALILYRHRSNVERLRAHSEPRF